MKFQTTPRKSYILYVAWRRQSFFHFSCCLEFIDHLGCHFKCAVSEKISRSKSDSSFKLQGKEQLQLMKKWLIGRAARKNLSSVLFQEAKFHKIHKRENINILRAKDVRKTSMIVLRFSGKKTGEQDMIFCFTHMLPAFISQRDWNYFLMLFRHCLELIPTTTKLIIWGKFFWINFIRKWKVF